MPGYAHGIEAYFNTINAQGGVHGYKVKYYVADTANQGPQAVTVTRNLVRSNKVVALISFGTVPATALIPIQPQLGIPMLISSNGDLFIPGKPGLYNAIPSYHAMWRYIIGLVSSQFHQQGFAYSYQSDAFGQPLPDVASDAAKSNGLKVLASVPLPANTTSNFTPYAARLKASKAPVVVLGMGTQLAAGVVKAATTLGYTPIWLSNWGVESPSFADAVGASVMKRVYAADYYQPEGTTDTPPYTAYKQAMQKYYPSEVSDQYAEQGWTYAAILSYAIGKAADTGKVTPQSIDSALSNITDQQLGLLPTLTYSPQAHNGVTQMNLLSYADNGWRQYAGFTPLPSP